MRIILQIFKFIFLTLFTLLAIGLLTAFLFCSRFLQYAEEDLMTSDSVIVDLGSMPVNLSSKIYYRDPDTGEYVEWYTLANTENRVWVDGANIPELFQNAFIAIEDERFWEHNGVDWKRTLAATASSLAGENVFGGSTITQQLIKNLTGDNQVTVKRKLSEICRALKLEERYSKDEILEWYMNVIYFGRGQYGVGAAARYYFGKEVAELSLAEMCSIVGITNNPSKYDPYSFPSNNKGRQEVILQKMLELGYINQAAYTQAIREQLVFSEHTEQQKQGTESYPYYVDAVIEDVIGFFSESAGVTREQATIMLYYGGYNIYTCVDMSIQEKMDSIYQNIENIPVTSDQQTLQSSMVVLDPFTGDIVGMEGGVGPKTVARGLNWATSPLGRRPPGSSFKPVAVYAPALDRGLISPDTYFLDSDSIVLKGTDWLPKNDSRKNYGVVSVRYGIVHSLNTIAAQVMDKLTPAESYQFLTQTLHMNLEPEDQDYAPLAVGQLSIGTTAREMASAFSIFPSGGTYRQGRTFSLIYDSEWQLVCENTPTTEAAVSDKTAYWITDILKEAVSSGTGIGAKLKGMPAAGKTGTTSDAKDRWFVGFTPYYVGAVWTGYEKPAKIHVSGNPAANLWKQVMTLIHQDLEEKSFPVPDDIRIPSVKYEIPQQAVKPDEEPEPEETEPEDVPEEEPLDPPIQDQPDEPAPAEDPVSEPEPPAETIDDNVADDPVEEEDSLPPAWLFG